jgi:phosphatidate cytidylyltransferase
MHLDTPNTRLRLIAAAVLMPTVLACIALGGWVYVAAVLLAMTLGMREWLRMIDPHAGPWVTLATYSALILSLGLGAQYGAVVGALAAIPLMLVVFMLAARRDLEKAGWLVTGIPYLAGSGLGLLYIRLETDSGIASVFFLMGVVWATDTAAYFGGKYIGGRKLLPEISPTKTWAGFLTGLAASLLLGLVLSLVFGARSTLMVMGLAVILSVVSQLGDLFESYVKRRTGVKDSGGLIPGHGGVLDRIDGLLFAAIFYVLFEIAIGAGGIW